MSMLMDLLPLIGGGLFGAVFKLIGLSMENKRVQNEMLIQMSTVRQKSIDNANEMAKESSGFAWTRRIIALSMTLMIGSLIFLPFINPEIPINIMTTVSEGGSYIFGLIDTTNTKEIWIELKGIVYLPIVGYSFQAVVGCYFGQSIITNSRR